MPATVIDGKALAAATKAEAAEKVKALKAQGINPCLAVILVGENPASQVYVRNKVRACERMKESKKLLHLTVFDGERERCILSGIAKWFKPEDLIGKKIGIVCNLAPRPMMKGKYVSEGMIFAADTADGGCSIAFYGDNTPVGSRIH